MQAWDGNLVHLFSFDPPSWSISVEFFLYACFPLLAPLVTCCAASVRCSPPPW